ncbi:NB-ARC domain containing protein [Trema orientale]|uniref:NB-ARC domain containing protein n=1 Tax=Trema orientale TaxID=63057 RepID=A0A2P5EMV3_TREOI|nr:NB-ARC domain containing protein [Trema orientale]
MADLVSGIAVNLLEKLGSLAYKEISSAWGIEDDLKKLGHTTSNLEAVLLDAEKKQEHNKQLEFWLIRLKDVFQDAQDVLDEFECEVLRSKVVKEYGSLGRKVRRFFSSSNPLAFRFSIAHHIKDVRQKLEETSTEMNKFNLVSIQLSQEQRHLMQGRREMTHSFVNASDVIGRDADKEKIIDMLMDKYHIGDDKISVLPIVGIGGLGKTTLAKLVYNDEKVVHKFDLRM